MDLDPNLPEREAKQLYFLSIILAIGPALTAAIAEKAGLEPTECSGILRSLREDRYVKSEPAGFDITDAGAQRIITLKRERDKRKSRGNQ